MSGFSFHFLPEEDRLALTFSKEDEAVPAVLLTRRLVKMLGAYLRQYVEKHTSLPESVSFEDKDDVFQFMHMSQLEENPQNWDGKQKREKKQELAGAKLATKINVQYTEKKVVLKFFRHKDHLVSLSLGWKEIHSFLYSLAEISRKADWGLEGTFEWCGRAFAGQSQEGVRQ
ncbi:MAG: hypothetical protein ACQEUB_09925 [Thermodesulfobacteriota bacterium]